MWRRHMSHILLFLSSFSESSDTVTARLTPGERNGHPLDSWPPSRHLGRIVHVLFSTSHVAASPCPETPGPTGSNGLLQISACCTYHHQSNDACLPDDGNGLFQHTIHDKVISSAEISHPPSGTVYILAIRHGVHLSPHTTSVLAAA
ncbi:hypothetical protein LX36DRAFT_323105 [Colletotrichum falcatum]|nr:hypothetical protein LX36DRAFT_323105 [Colletotrichum falcatum]